MSVALLRIPPGHCLACHCDAWRNGIIRLPLDGECRPGQTFLIAARKEMSVGHPGLRQKNTCVEWAQTQSHLKLLNCCVQITEINLRPARPISCRGHVWIEINGP